MAKIKLTDRYLTGLKPPVSGRLEVSDAFHTGLRFRVYPTGSKVWVFEKRIKGGPKRTHTLGDYPGVKIAEARAMAAELAREAFLGIDRIADTQRERTDLPIVRDALDAYDGLHLVNLRTADERRRMLYQALGSHLDKPIATLERRHLQAFVDAKAKEGRKIYANRFMAALSAFTKFAWQRGYTETNIGAGLSRATRETPRDRVLSPEEVRQIWGATYSEGELWGPLVRLLILTAQRRSDITALQWQEVDLERARISLSSARTKNAKPHITHLSVPAIAELNALRRQEPRSAFVFTTTGTTPVSGLSKVKARLDVALGDNFEPWRFHDLRTAFATAMAEVGEPEVVVDRILNHSASGSATSAVARVYNRSEQLPHRACVLDRWAAMVIGEAVKIVPLRHGGQ